jgi:multiple antibiotic resistance protein
VPDSAWGIKECSDAGRRLVQRGARPHSHDVESAARARASRDVPAGRDARRQQSPARRRKAAIDASALTAAFVTLLIVVEPLGLAPIFLVATTGYGAEARAGIAARACLYAFFILMGAALGGEALLRAMGVSLPAFRIAGGLLLFSIASEMALGVRIGRDSATAARAVEENGRNIAAFPLAIPLMAGPGAITATLLLAGETAGAPAQLAGLIGAIGAVMAICWIVCSLAARLERYLSASASTVLEKLIGVLLAALAVQFVVDGARSLFAT